MATLLCSSLVVLVRRAWGSVFVAGELGETEMGVMEELGSILVIRDVAKKTGPILDRKNNDDYDILILQYYYLTIIEWQQCPNNGLRRCARYSKKYPDSNNAYL